MGAFEFMEQFWILEEINTHRPDADKELMEQLIGGLCSGMSYTIYPDDTKTLQVNVLYKANNSTYNVTTYTTFDIIDCKETEDTLWFKDNIGTYLFRKTDLGIQSYIEGAVNKTKFEA